MHFRSAVTLALVLVPGIAGAQATTATVSVSTGGVPANNSCSAPAVSNDGRFVAFVSWASNLVPSDANADTDVFLRDTHAGTTVRVSERPGGLDADGGSNRPFLSSDGTVLVFTTWAPNLSPVPVPPGSRFVLAYDRVTGALTPCHSLTPAAGCSPTDPLDYRGAGLSSNGRYVTLLRRCSGGSNWSLEVLDRQSGTTQHVGSVDYTASIEKAPVSNDARFVAYFSASSVPGGMGVHDRTSGRFWSMLGLAPNGVWAAWPALTPDGRFFAFSTPWRALGWDQNSVDDVYLFDRQRHSLTIMSVTPSGESHNGTGVHDWTSSPAISADGLVLAFGTTATNLVPGTPAGAGVIIRRTDTGSTELVSLDSSGAPLAPAGQPALSADARFVAFVAGEPISQVYLRDRWFAGPARYCEPKRNSHGCLPAIGASGSPSLGGADDFHITCSQVISQSPGIVFWGGAPAFVPFGGGTRCVKSPIVRTPVRVSAGPAGQGCAGTYDFHFSHGYMAAHLLGPGATVFAQYWQRDAAHPDGTGQGLTDGLQFTITP